MFTKRVTLFRLFGFAVRVDASWIFLAVLITWSLAEGVFPHYFKDLSKAAYWWMGVLGALGLFVSIVFHELSHSLVARQFGMPIEGITLFIFGGVAEMTEEPPNAKSEFWMAIAGPLASVLLAVIFYAIYYVAGPVNEKLPIFGVIIYLAWLNGILAVFNMVPAFPLDGGRVFRAILWGIKGNLSWATRIASVIGAGFGVALIALGFYALLVGNIIGGIWWIMIGLFMRTASQMSYKQLLIRRALEGEHVRRFMNTSPVTVPSTASIQDLVEEYIYKLHFKMYPVTENGHLLGCITTREARSVPINEWGMHTVKEHIQHWSDDNSVSPDDDAMAALNKMSRTGNSRLMVVENNELVGILSLKDMLEFLSLKLDLESKS